ncbi:peptidyl-dipeptidase Dcp [Silvibacterium bohemicum]|uniref:Dipeptidyl carboxypeptidase n=1 Tax=Silvibacterium bohemicum TaxID=1577686 RepID=A0A841JYL8_9BACT|nr:peptidyl-dipeptidase Dcp [Silvibacterium bohemicum]MBB6145507.1 peptidyl-dipeptidase Dcp [Silvibacterium bohemicum]
MAHLRILTAAGVLVAGILFSAPSPAMAFTTMDFGPSNPFYAPSTLPFHAPPFDKIKDSDYQPAIEAGMAQQLREIEAIADNPAPPTLENTLVAMEKSGELFNRATQAFDGVTGANTNPTLQEVKKIEAPKLAAHDDAIYLNDKLFRRVEAIYQQRGSLHLDAESLRLVEIYYQRFVHAGAKLSPADKATLKKLNEEASSLSNAFSSKLLDATKEAAYFTPDKAALAGLNDAQIAAAEQAAKGRGKEGYLLPLQNTTQQPDLAGLSDRATRQALFQASWTRAVRGDANDTRDTIARLAQLRAQKAKLLGYPSFAAWKLEDQMAKTPSAALAFMDGLVPAATAKAAGEAKDIQALIDNQHGGFTLQPWDWNFYAEQVRKARYDLDESQVKPYFELNNVLENGVFYAAGQLYGITFEERKDIPVYHPDVRVFEVFDAGHKPLALFYCDYFKRDNKNGGAWMSEFVGQSRLLGTLPVVYNVANFTKPAPGQPALISFSDVTTMFHEFGHALHGMFSDTEYPLLAGTDVPRDFVEFPSQFNEHWALYPSVFSHYAKHYQTGEPMPAELAAKIKQSSRFNQGYALTELVAAAELDMQWHTLPADAPLQHPDEFEAQALSKTHLSIRYVPPRYRSSYFSHIWGSGYAAGYYAYLWSEMLDDDAYQWFEDHGGLTRANGDRFRKMVLSRGNTEDLEELYAAWLGSKPRIEPMLKYRGLDQAPESK